VAELDRKLMELQEGRGDWNEFWQWWDEHFAIKGKGILNDLLKRRELARGWNSRQKRPRKKSS
ncbi:MAG: hypothetical protein NZ937_09950, partial [Armatimonadetes bacterium]|nr:hypothetical protein [Armatimonadota bacterium]